MPFEDFSNILKAETTGKFNGEKAVLAPHMVKNANFQYMFCPERVNESVHLNIT